MKKITLAELKILAKYIYDISGIHLDESKAYLLETRLKHLMEGTGAVTYHELYHKAKSDPTHILERKIIDAICTQETMFFRDNSPFELLRNRILPELIARKTSHASILPVNIRIWSAGCSTGQEMYSIAIILKEFLANPLKFNIRLLGTDISDAAISGAISGQYSQAAVERGLSEDRQSKYFRQNGQMWKIREDIRAMCTFRKHNLMGLLNELGNFDIVFCRNVAIYFQKEDKVKLFDRIADILDPDGYLIAGSSESISGINPKFEVATHSNMIFYKLKK